MKLPGECVSLPRSPILQRESPEQVVCSANQEGAALAVGQLSSRDSLWPNRQIFPPQSVYTRHSVHFKQKHILRESILCTTVGGRLGRFVDSSSQWHPHCNGCNDVSSSSPRATSNFSTSGFHHRSIVIMQYSIGRPTVTTVALLYAILICHTFGGEFQTSLFCPQGCFCPREEEVLCDGVDLKNIPQEMSPKLRNLSISRANIEQIGADDFRFFPHLERLSLSNCGLLRVEEYTFAELSRLQFVTLLHNPLTELSSYSFSGLKHLKELIIRTSALHRIAAFTFFGSASIRVLDLRSDSIRRIEAEAFNGLYDVQFLHLPINLETIEPNAFHNLSRVHFIDIRQWRANDSDWDGVAKYTFRGMKHVSSIRMDQCNLGTIHSGAFDQLETVETVQIRNCRIASIRNAFSGMRNVGKLELLSNQIGHVARFAFENIPSEDVYSLKIVDNEIDCSCRNGWLIYNYGSLENDTLKRNYCSAPEHLARKLLRNIGRDYVANCTARYVYHHLDKENGGAPVAIPYVLISLLVCLVLHADGKLA
uniref:LRRNT domain-containing protein n=1 Tax=Trichuris muris TaxID=70415 RepID=A0A5S6QM45_TRIMR